jgi:hypothetical protein
MDEFNENTIKHGREFLSKILKDKRILHVAV